MSGGGVREERRVERKEANAIDWDRYRSGASGGRIFGKWAKQVLWVSGVCTVSYQCLAVTLTRVILLFAFESPPVPVPLAAEKLVVR